MVKKKTEGKIVHTGFDLRSEDSSPQTQTGMYVWQEENVQKKADPYTSKKKDQRECGRRQR